MHETAKGKVLCIEDTLDWQNRLKKAINGETGFHVDVVGTYAQAARAEFSKYDVCTLDSRLEGDRPRLLPLIRLIRKKSPDGLPVLVALTAFWEDVGEWERGELFDVVKKSDVDTDPIVLKKRLLRAFYQSVEIQARDLLAQAVEGRPEVMHDDSPIARLEELVPQMPSQLQQGSRVVLGKYEFYRKRIDSLEEVLLDCYGFVSGIRGDEVEVVMVLPNGREMRRIFDGDVCAAAGVHFQDAPFRYTVVKKGPCVSSIVRAGRPPATYPGVVSMPEIDMSVFDEPDKNRE